MQSDTYFYLLLIYFTIFLPLTALAPEFKSKEKFCLRCGTTDKPRRELAGSFVMQFIWGMFLIVPGVLYTINRYKKQKHFCKNCGSSTDLIPTNSPLAQEFKSKNKVG